MSMVTLVSGGLDSTLVALLSKEEGITQFPLFIDYGQICFDREWSACVSVHANLGLPLPIKMNLKGYGELIPSGITKITMRVNEDAFLPGRNLLFLLAGCAYAYTTNSDAVAIGLLSEETHIYPDQTSQFLEQAANMFKLSLNYDIHLIAPLMKFSKSDVLELAKRKGITGTYSCHAGTDPPCGICISCREVMDTI